MKRLLLSKLVFLFFVLENSVSLGVTPCEEWLAKLVSPEILQMLGKHSVRLYGFQSGPNDLTEPPAEHHRDVILVVSRNTKRAASDLSKVFGEDAVYEDTHFIPFLNGHLPSRYSWGNYGWMFNAGLVYFGLFYFVLPELYQVSSFGLGFENWLVHDLPLALSKPKFLLKSIFSIGHGTIASGIMGAGIYVDMSDWSPINSGFAEWLGGTVGPKSGVRVIVVSPRASERYEKAISNLFTYTGVGAVSGLQPQKAGGLLTALFESPAEVTGNNETTPPNWAQAVSNFRAHYLGGLSRKSYVRPFVKLGGIIREKVTGVKPEGVGFRDLKDGRVMVEVVPGDGKDPYKFILPVDPESMRELSDYLDGRRRLPMPKAATKPDSTKGVSPDEKQIPPPHSSVDLDPIDFEYRE